jgi:starch synthase
MNRAFAIIDATTKENLEKLTIHRIPSALPFGGKYRLIDFTLSNLTNSEVYNVAIFPYGNYRSLQDHIGSGKRWDLDRKHDGLFILPPKNALTEPGSMISFQRMYEHIEFIRRSEQPYCIITSANIIWNIDFKEAITYHISSQSDVTEIIYKKTRLKTFILNKELLLKYVTNYESQEYQDILALIEKAPNLRVSLYAHHDFTKVITDASSYLKANLDLLNFSYGLSLFHPSRPVYSKERNAPPTHYKESAVIKNSIISSGARINGTVINSVIGRDVVVKKGAVIENSVINSNTIVYENAVVKFAVLDKETVVRSQVEIEGSLNTPFVSQKKQVITTQKHIRILQVAAESYPFIKTGGLADMVGSLSQNLALHDVDTSVVIPLYKDIKEHFSESLKREYSIPITFNLKTYKITLYTYYFKKVNYYFIDSFDFFDRERVYGYEDDIERFAFFNKAVIALLDHLNDFDLIHLHDWHTAMIPSLLDQTEYKEVKTLLTIHNISYQGKTDKDIFKMLDLRKTMNYFNSLELGILTASKISTVSSTYRDELHYQYYAGDLTASIISRERDFYGILNGITSKWSPTIDPYIYQTYSESTLNDKWLNKQYVQRKYGLSESKDTFLIGMVSRIVEHKGFDLIVSILPSLLEDYDIQFVLLGTGEQKFVDQLKQIEQAYPTQFKFNFGFFSEVPNYIYASADLFLMPSRIEPCGLSQMIAMKYGAVPLVRETGGLKDSVTRYNQIERSGNGFSFYPYDSRYLKDELLHAYDIFKNHKDDWQQIMKCALSSDFSIYKTTMKYIDLYKTIIFS